MKTFNKYQFIEDLENDIVKRINKGDIDCLEAIYDEMHDTIDDACIYYSNCFDICKELNATQFDDYDMECKNISQLAYACLYQYTMDELDINKLEKLIETINA
jgi:hypothetical protein